MNLYYLHFNNYYNRIVKKFDTLAEYLTLPYYDNVLTASIAFNPNDGVDTKQVANVPVGNEFTYDYCVLADGNDIVSRWFIIDANRNRNGQYTLTLRRDMFADSYEPVLDAPAFIEKATLRNNDPMIFNSENMTFNQIKKGENLLKDSTGCPWIVGYLANGTDVTEQTLEYVTPSYYDSLESFQSDWESFKSNIGDNMIVSDYPSTHLTLNLLAKRDGYQYNTIFSITESGYSINFDLYNSDATVIYNVNNENSVPNNYIANFSNIAETAKNYYNIRSKSDADKILDYNNKILRDGNTYYRVKITAVTPLSIDLGAVRTGSMYSTLNEITFNNYFLSGNVSNYNTYKMSLFGTVYTYSLTEVSGKSLKYQISSANVNHLVDSPYMMFAIPYGACSFNTPDGTVVVNESDGKNIAVTVANSIIESLNSANNADALYDIQLLPYCPFQNNIDANGVVNFSTNSFYSFINNSTDPTLHISLICWAEESRFSFNIPYTIDIINPKIESQTDMYRLCSPNWNGQFEFNAAKNGGVATINVDCEYKPFQPYIHLNPNFGVLYGQDFDDARGLVCNGDFSLTQIANAWATYQRQNVNFEKQFNRQIQNMEVNNAIQNIQAATQATLGTVGGVLGGFMAGGIGGAIMGGTASAVGGTIDYALQRAGQAEAIDYTRDQFGYSLGNIKALPDSLTKVSAFNNNNKIFPVMEYYTCTEEEKVALENKLKYNGMTVMRIGTIREFLKSEKSYIKGKLIRLENFNEDFHYVNELANEFNKGVFI